MKPIEKNTAMTLLLGLTPRISWNCLLITKKIVRDKKEIDRSKVFINSNLIPVVVIIGLAIRKDKADISSKRIFRAIFFTPD